ncbi:MAG TPA: 30S ribosomal protein S8 [Candidatus Krumholzibacteria bacterium]|nr:30S ribosomal protein S8 [Candidatus Krumholzibacteria bacterium]
MMTDPIADMLTRIRNGAKARKRRVDIPASKMKRAVAELLVREGYLRSVKFLEEGPQGTLRIYLKYSEERIPAFEGIERVSKPGLRRYVPKDEIPKVLGGYGTAVVSTSKGILTGHQARMAGVGGEVLCKVW